MSVSRLHSSVPTLPRDRIMDLPQFALLGIFSIVLSGIPEASSWRSNEDRSDGYDLQRGPVFYEAYYPENLGPTASGQQLIPIDANVPRRYPNIFQKTREDSRRDARQLRDRGFASDYDWSSQPSQSSDSSDSLVDISKVSNEPTNRIADSIEAQNIALQLKRLVESLRQDTILRTATTNFRRPYTRKNYDENSNSFPDERLDESINMILSAVRNGALKISEDSPGKLPVDSTQAKEENMRVESHERLIGSDDLVRLYRPSITPDVSNLEEKRGAVWSGSFDRMTDDRFERTSGDEYGDVRGPISGMALARMENIFQPRPQVISYVFSPMRALTKALSLTTNSDTTQTRSIRSNERATGNDADRIIDAGVKDRTSPGVASIEISEIPRHKIRHHHGEKPRRDHQHRQATARN